jgi:DNA polymerase (family 10)
MQIASNVKNLEVAKILYEIADYLDIQGVAFRPMAYRKAARIIEDQQEDLDKIRERGELTKIQGIGKNLANKIEEYLKEGRISLHERLKKQIPEGVLRILAIPGVGPKTASFLFVEMGITSLEELEKAAKERRLRRKKGFTEKTEMKILKGIELLKRYEGRMLLGDALPIAEEIIRDIKSQCKVEKISVAGSLRRMRETVGDIDILATSSDPDTIMEVFSNLPQVKEVALKGHTKTTVYLRQGGQTDLRVVEPESYGAALQYFTGSKDHNIHLRTIAQKMGYKVNEYGLFEGQKRIAGETEEGIYETLEMSYIEPEMREDKGEIRASQKGELPNLVRMEDIKGDFHVHTDWSDGMGSIQEMAEAAKEMGHKFIGIADHTKSLKVAGGLDEDELALQLKEVRKIDREMKGFKVLAGTEVDIKDNGELDLDDSILKQLDVVIGAVHSRFKMSKDAMTGRIVEAMRNENVDIISHPTGRLIGSREPYEMDMDKVIEEAVNTRTAFEINCFPDRLDLNAPNAKTARDRGAKIALGTDSHMPFNLSFIRYGVGVARRGWLESRDVINTWSVQKILKYFG